MAHFGNSLRRLLSIQKDTRHREKDFDGAVIRMSDLNHSYSDPIKSKKNDAINDKLRTSTLTREGTQVMLENEIRDALTEELNDIDFQKFVQDLAGTNSLMHLQLPNSEKQSMDSQEIAKKEFVIGARHMLSFERSERKEVVTFESRPNENDGAMQVVKLRVKVPRRARNAINVITATSNLQNLSLEMVGSKTNLNEVRDCKIVEDPQRTEIVVTKHVEDLCAQRPENAQDFDVMKHCETNLCAQGSKNDFNVMKHCENVEGVTKFYENVEYLRSSEPRVLQSSVITHTSRMKDFEAMPKRPLKDSSKQILIQNPSKISEEIVPNYENVEDSSKTKLYEVPRMTNGEITQAKSSTPTEGSVKMKNVEKHFKNSSGNVNIIMKNEDFSKSYVKVVMEHDRVHSNPKKASSKPNVNVEMEEEKIKTLISKSNNYKPLMGKNALMAKANATASRRLDRSDSEIVQELVTERFSNFFNNYYQRSFHRHSRLYRSMEDGNEEHSEDSGADAVLERNSVSRSNLMYARTGDGGTVEHTIEDCHFKAFEDNHIVGLEDRRTNPQTNRMLGSTKDLLSSNGDFLRKRRLDQSEEFFGASVETTTSGIAEEEKRAETSIQTYESLTNYARALSLNETSTTQSTTTMNSFRISASTPSGSNGRSSTPKNFSDLDFLLSTDEHNIETSAGNTREFTDSVDDDSDRVSYDAHKFLTDALGDELKTYISTDSQMISDLDCSENQSIGTSNISDLLSKASSYSGMQHAQDRPTKRNSTIYEERINEYEEYISNDQRLTDLIAEANVQKQIIAQTYKALSFCKKTKEFVASVEEVEAERILLLATLKFEALKEEIQRMEYEDLAEHLDQSAGCVKVKGLTFPPKPRNSFVPNLFDKRRKDFTHWFVGVLKSGPTVFATKPTVPDSDGMVKFEEEFVFDNLSPDFHVIVAIYCIRIKNNIRNYSHESKFHLNKNLKTTCPSPQKFFHITRDNKTKLTDETFGESSFVLAGTCVIGINNLRDLGYFKLSDMPLCSMLEGTVVINFLTGVNLKETHSDFLNVGNETGEFIAWNRRWCSLKGPHLLYYSCPEDEEPIQVLDLSYCATAYVTAVERRLCARPRTLLLETGEKSAHIVRHFLAADTTQAMKVWESKLNNTVSALRNWNCTKCNFTFSKN